MKKQTVKERLDFIYNYRFDCSKDYIERLKPITDSLLNQVEEMKKAMQATLIHLNDGDYKAAESKLNKVLEG